MAKFMAVSVLEQQDLICLRAVITEACASQLPSAAASPLTLAYGRRRTASEWGSEAVCCSAWVGAGRKGRCSSLCCAVHCATQIALQNCCPTLAGWTRCPPAHEPDAQVEWQGRLH